MISKDDGKMLISLARKAIASVFEGEKIEAEEYLRYKFSEPQGVFVTLNINDELRGCIGFAEPIFPLFDGVIRAAKAAAFEDPRFLRLQKEEFKHVKIEVSVLSLPKLIEAKKPEDYLTKIKIGRHGLIIRGLHGSGLLLPQVFTDYNCTPKIALGMTCQKASLSMDAWKDRDNKIYSFEAWVFKEE